MTKIHQDWKDLPSEILLQIFLSATKAELRKCALVCKAWSDPAQSILYSNVIIVNPQQLQKFYSSITRTLHLGEQVKCLCVNSIPSRYDQYPIENFSELLSNMLCSGLLTNLQELDISILNTYIPVLSALLNLRLKALKVLHPPRKDLNRDQRVIYASCILLMRDRVEKVALYNEEARANNFRSNHLYNNLNQLRVLKEVKISDDIGDQWIQSVEHVTASCKALKKLTLDFKVGNNNKDVDMSSIVPSTNIESLNVQLRDKRMLFHIMHKFPQLREITINNWNCELVSEEYLQLLAFISKIDAFQITRLYVNHNIAELTAHYWDTTLARTGSKIVKALYHDIDIYEDYGIEISKLKDEKRPTFSFSYHQIQANPQHIETVDMLGKYIGEFHFIYGKRKNSSKGDLPQLFMDHLFMRCPHLHTLYFEGWVFHKRYLLLQNFPIDELYFKNCSIYGAFLSHFSTFLPQLKRLILEEVSYHTENNDLPWRHGNVYYTSRTLEIDMPHTKIDCITFIKCDYGTPYYIKLFVKSNNTVYYNLHKERYFTSNEGEYNNAEKHNTIYICCKNKPKILFKCQFNKKE